MGAAGFSCGVGAAGFGGAGGVAADTGVLFFGSTAGGGAAGALAFTTAGGAAGPGTGAGWLLTGGGTAVFGAAAGAAGGFFPFGEATMSCRDAASDDARRVKRACKALLSWSEALEVARVRSRSCPSATSRRLNRASSRSISSEPMARCQHQSDSNTSVVLDKGGEGSGAAQGGVGCCRAQLTEKSKDFLWPAAGTPQLLPSVRIFLVPNHRVLPTN